MGILLDRPDRVDPPPRPPMRVYYAGREASNTNVTQAIGDRVKVVVEGSQECVHAFHVPCGTNVHFLFADETQTQRIFVLELKLDGNRARPMLKAQ